MKRGNVRRLRFSDSGGYDDRGFVSPIGFSVCVAIPSRGGGSSQPVNKRVGILREECCRLTVVPDRVVPYREVVAVVVRIESVDVVVWQKRRDGQRGWGPHKRSKAKMTRPRIISHFFSKTERHITCNSNSSPGGGLTFSASFHRSIFLSLYLNISLPHPA